MPNDVAALLARYVAAGVTGPDDQNPPRLASHVEAPATAAEITAAWGDDAAADAVALWRATREAWLFRDLAYGQWGVHVLTPAASRARTQLEWSSHRAEDMRPGDVVVAEFLGDQELLVVAPSEPPERRILVALPLDFRAEWYAAAGGIAEFLHRFRAAGGDKYWEVHA